MCDVDPTACGIAGLVPLRPVSRAVGLSGVVRFARLRWVMAMQIVRRMMRNTLRP
jgi:hypothetical protein